MPKTTPAAASWPGLPPNDPDYIRFKVETGMQNDATALQVAVMYVMSIPPALRRDATESAARLSGIGAEAITEAVIAEGIRRAEPDLAAADQARDSAKAANDQLEVIIYERQGLPDELVNTGALTIRRQQNKANLTVLQQVAEKRALGGDRDHEDRPGAGIVGWIVAIIVGVVEAGITIRIWNVDVQHLGWSALTWLAITAGLVIFNHWVIKEAGALQRDYREIRKQNRITAEESIGRTQGDYLGGNR